MKKKGCLLSSCIKNEISDSYTPIDIFKLNSVLTSLFFVFCLNLFAQQGPGLYIDPATIDFSLLNNQSSTRPITISNKLNVPKQFSIYLNDWQRDSVGGHIYQSPGSNSRTCANWITLDKTFVELDPGESATINVKMAVPDSAEAVKQMRWAMVFVESIEETKAPSKTQGVNTSIQTRYRIGVHVYQTPPTKINKEVRMLRFGPVINTADSVYRIECQNTGDVQLKCNSFIELSNVADGSKVTLDPVDFPLFPEQKRYVDFILPKNMVKGKYTMTAMVDAGEDVPLEAAQKMIEIK